MADYQGNSKKQKEAEAKPEKEKIVERVTVGEVIIRKPTRTQKAKDLIIAADFRTVFRHVGTNVLLPALKNMIYDSSSRTVESMLFGERASQQRMYGQQGPRITYNTPVNRGPLSEPRGTRYAPSVSPEPRGLPIQRYSSDVIILASKEEAEMVLEAMNDIIDAYDVASVQDLKALIGSPIAHTDNKWGWVVLGGVPIRQVREGFLIDFPPPDPLQ